MEKEARDAAQTNFIAIMNRATLYIALIDAYGIGRREFFDTPLPVCIDQPGMFPRNALIRKDNIIFPRLASNCYDWLANRKSAPSHRASNKTDRTQTLRSVYHVHTIVCLSR